MASDLLSTIHREIDVRLRELRPLLAEYERLRAAADALVVAGQAPGVSSPTEKATRPRSVPRRTRTGSARRGSAAGAIELAVAGPMKTSGGEQIYSASTPLLNGDDPEHVMTPSSSASKSRNKSERAARGAAREAILAALEHGSHTVGELSVVTAMSGPNISGNLRKLVSEGAVLKTEREGKAAWALPHPVL